MTTTEGQPKHPGAFQENGSRHSVLVLRKVRAILECFSPNESELTLLELRQRTGFPASTCQRLLGTLAEEGFLDRRGDRYRIGLRLVSWASSGTIGLDLIRLAQPVLRRLRDEVAESAVLYVRDGMFRTCVAVAEARHPVMRQVFVGKVMVLSAGSAGKVFLAYDSEALDAVLGRGLVRYTEYTIVDLDAFRQELVRIRERGYSFSFEEREAGAASISAPIFGRTGEIIAAMGIGVPVQRLRPENVSALAPEIVAAAQEVSHRMGYVGPRTLAGEV